MKVKLLKRAADALEKLGVASIAVGLFQDKEEALWVGGVCLVLSFALTTLEAML